MAIRETLQRNKTWSASLIIGLFVAAAAIGYGLSPSRIPAPPIKAYFSKDDGKTFFTDQLDKPAPFDHEGAKAYRADVFETASGTRFVAYLERLNDKGLARVLELQSVPKEKQDINEISLVWGKALEVKKPGESKWVPVGSKEAGIIMTPKAPDGSTQFHIVFP